MEVMLLYIDGCLGWKVAQRRLGEAARQVGLAERSFVYHAVRTPQEAKQLSFRGSPTILIDGRDPFPGGDAGSGLSCRLYDGAAGPDQAPSVEQLIAALQQQQPGMAPDRIGPL